MATSARTPNAPHNSCSRNGLADSWGEADGRVGPNTFGKADDRLVKGGGSTDPGKVLYLSYNSGLEYFHLYRSTSGIYWFQIGHGSTWHGTSYASRNNRLRLTGRFTQERDVCTGSPSARLGVSCWRGWSDEGGRRPIPPGAGWPGAPAFKTTHLKEYLEARWVRV
ncbi:hypothetical protein [Streptomyces sp. KL116D]|uniref:hypothetical protein n=1 Tax=Streptomyces sp. KL116D TaxID=3045152 RepID=UPI00355642B2